MRVYETQYSKHSHMILSPICMHKKVHMQHSRQTFTLIPYSFTIWSNRLKSIKQRTNENLAFSLSTVLVIFETFYSDRSFLFFGRYRKCKKKAGSQFGSCYWIIWEWLSPISVTWDTFTMTEIVRLWFSARQSKSHHARPSLLIDSRVLEKKYFLCSSGRLCYHLNSVLVSNPKRQQWSNEVQYGWKDSKSAVSYPSIYILDVKIILIIDNYHSS